MVDTANTQQTTHVQQLTMRSKQQIKIYTCNVGDSSVVLKENFQEDSMEIFSSNVSEALIINREVVSWQRCHL